MIEMCVGGVIAGCVSLISIQLPKIEDQNNELIETILDKR